MTCQCGLRGVRGSSTEFSLVVSAYGVDAGGNIGLLLIPIGQAFLQDLRYRYGRSYASSTDPDSESKEERKEYL